MQPFQATTNFSDWMDLGVVEMVGLSEAEFIDLYPESPLRRFYRVLVECSGLTPP